MKKDYSISLIIICATILISSIILRGTNFSINNSSIEKAIYVEGDGEIHATPDTLILSVRVEESASTTKEAQANADKKISQIKEIISNYKIQDSDIQTSDMNIYEDYDRTEKGRISKGYIASHTLQIKIKEVDIKNAGVAGKIISELSNIGGVLINNVSYDIYDKNEYYSQARELAIQKAQQKAEDLAKYAGVKLGDPISISESQNYDYAMNNSKNLAIYNMENTVDEDYSDSDISLGEMDISVNVSIEYELK